MAVNRYCERTGAERGVALQKENPGPGEKGTVLSVRWRASWTREHRQEATAPASPIAPKLIPWQQMVSVEIPAFLQPLPHRRLVLYTKHRDCFVKDGLVHHLVHHHRRTEEQAWELCLSCPTFEVAETWDDIVHPRARMPAIPHLQVIHAFRCAVGLCEYKTAMTSSWLAHCRETGHNIEELVEETMFYQTLSSCPDNIHYFPVYPLDEDADNSESV
jgi:hypothetical protein